MHSLTRRILLIGMTGVVIIAPVGLGIRNTHAEEMTEDTFIAVASEVPAGRSVLFRKTADVQEVLPGGEIRYTMHIQNVLLNVIDDAFIIDRFDPAFAQVADDGGAIITNPGQLRWVLPKLNPGDVWQISYGLSVAENVPKGTVIGNIASIAGRDVESATLEEKIAVVRTGVVNRLPPTGAALDVLFILSVTLLAAAVSLLHLQRAKRF